MAAKRNLKKATRKAGKAAKAASRPARKRAPRVTLAPKAVKTGRGASPVELAKELVALMRAGKMAEVETRLLAPAIESVEGMGASMAWKGKKAVLAKYRGWEADHEIHEMRIEGPWVGATGFAVKYWIDVTQRSTGQRSQLEEIAVYTVQNGKIVREEFHFALGA